jgi:NADH-ubiquinone oxidoreductase chain 6
MNWLFYLFSSLALTSGVMVIGSRNPVHSVLFLILVFFNGAGLLVLLELDFFAMIFLVVYVGAIAVLFLFVVMMLNVRLTEMNEKRLRYLPIGGLLAFLFLAEIFLIVDNDLIPPLGSRGFSTQSFFPGSTLGTMQPLWGAPAPWTGWSHLLQPLTPLEAVGGLIYTYYFYLFLVASLILLVAMIGAIVLTLHKGVNVKRQEVFQQNTREFGKTVSNLSA